MDADKTPALPAEMNTIGGFRGEEGLQPVPWDQANTGTLEDSDRSVPVSLAEWRDGIGADSVTGDGADARLTLMHVRVTPTDDSVTLDADAIAGAALRTHVPPHGVAVIESGATVTMLFVLPDGVSWPTVVETIKQGCGEAEVTVSIGLADAFSMGQTVDDAVRLATDASAKAAEAGEPAMARALCDENDDRRDADIVASLVESIESGTGLRLVFQPKYDTQTRELVGAEGLLRHECADIGPIGPTEFLAVAERAGILDRVERWVVDAGIEAIAAWEKSGALSVPVSINVAPVDALDASFAKSLAEKIEAAGIDPAHLRIEIAEAGVVSDLEVAKERLGAIRDLGVSVALDDFGAAEGTAMADLRGMPIDVLKVHRSFVLGMESNVGLSALVQGVVSLARALGIHTVAAGVETESQLESLADFGCDTVQGFLLSEPLEASDFEKLLLRS